MPKSQVPSQEYEVWPEMPEQSVHEQHQFCDDPSCGCHSDADLINGLNQQYQDGLASAEDATRIWRGKTV